MKLLPILLMALLGCATYQDHVGRARSYLQDGKIEEALKDLQPKADRKNDDQLVYVLDYATALQYANRLDESNRYFMLADRLAEEKDYHSASRVAGSLLFNEEMVQYKGDAFEKAFIHVFLALNFLQKSDFDAAMVEVRKMNEKYSQARLAEKKSFEINPFSRYLSAVVYEALGQWDDAFIAYRETYKIDSNWHRLQQDILRTAMLSNRLDDLKQWQTKFPEQVVTVDRKLRRSHGFLKLIYLQGWGPRKQPDPREPLVPTLAPVYSRTQKAQLLVNNEVKAQSTLVYDTTEASIATLAEDRGALIARRIAARIAREAVARELGRNDDTAVAGLVGFIAMQASERADLRQWSFLPSSVQMAEVQIPIGEYEVSAQGLDASGQPTAEVSGVKKVRILPGKTEFFVWRSVQ